MFDDTRGGGGDGGGDEFFFFGKRFRMSRYILEGHTPVECPDLMTWAMWFEHADRRVASHRFRGLHVSSAFMGLDMGFGERPEPVLFETAIFNARGVVVHQARTCTWNEALIAHRWALWLARSYRSARALARLDAGTRAYVTGTFSD